MGRDKEERNEMVQGDSGSKRSGKRNSNKISGGHSYGSMALRRRLR